MSIKDHLPQLMHWAHWGCWASAVLDVTVWCHNTALFSLIEIFIKAVSIYVHYPNAYRYTYFQKCTFLQFVNLFHLFYRNKAVKTFYRIVYFFFQHNYSTSSYGSMNSHTEGPGSGVGIPRSYPNTHRQPQVGTNIQK